MLPHALKGLDVLLQASCGSGKTLAYAVPLLAAVDPEDDRCQGMVVVGTRELAAQVVGVLTRLTSHCPRVRVRACSDALALPGERHLGAHVVVGTLGGLHSLVNKGCIHLHHLRLAVFDDMDALSNPGSFPAAGCRDAAEVMRLLRPRSTPVLTSATLQDHAASGAWSPPQVTPRSRSDCGSSTTSRCSDASSWREGVSASSGGGGASGASAAGSSRSIFSGQIIVTTTFLSTVQAAEYTQLLREGSRVTLAEKSGVCVCACILGSWVPWDTL